ncbi:TetR/AcrR family transcriptional regulator [Novosphingobium sp. ZW T3_23]|uniref:TetR/AcrR family transcriptional regulator n=1 Tax=Novosphingobium sp. ZW T3_23 TaxID=3378084 RepID=UPI003854B2B4
MRAAFLNLIAERPLDDISIKEICDAAGLSYPTFYRRFSGKDELLASIATEEVRQLLTFGFTALEAQDERGGNSAAAMCSYVADHRALWRTLLTGGAADAMRQEFMRRSRDIAESRPRSNPWLPVDLAVPFVTAGVFEILAWWMKQPDDYPTANVATLIEVLILELTARPRSIELS